MMFVQNEFRMNEFHMNELQMEMAHIPSWAKEEHMEQCVAERELWSYENKDK